MAELILPGCSVALIDDEDVRLVTSFRWSLNRVTGYVLGHGRKPSGLRTTVMLHRLIMDAPNGLDVDHINHDPLDCRRSNLRIATRSQNMQNRRGATRKSVTGIRGVSRYVTRCGIVKYLARINVAGRSIYRCGFSTADEANDAAVKLRRKYFTHSTEVSY
jgi:hypothetical protein